MAVGRRSAHRQAPMAFLMILERQRERPANPQRQLNQSVTYSSGEFSIMQRPLSNFLRICLRRLSRVGLRIVISGLIFMTCLMVASRYMGVPVPSPSDLLETIKDVSKLSEVLS
jgi:hypothetical protein